MGLNGRCVVASTCIAFLESCCSQNNVTLCSAVYSSQSSSCGAHCPSTKHSDCRCIDETPEAKGQLLVSTIEPHNFTGKVTYGHFTSSSNADMQGLLHKGLRVAKGNSNAKWFSVPNPVKKLTVTQLAIINGHVKSGILQFRSDLLSCRRLHLALCI